MSDYWAKYEREVYRELPQGSAQRVSKLYATFVPRDDT